MDTIGGIKQNQRGSSLLEVMIALFVLAIGLLGTLAMQTESIKANQNSYSYSLAVYLASDMAERIRANTGAVYALGDTEPTSPCTTCAAATAVMQRDIYQWNTLIKNSQHGLPSGKGKITASGSNYLIEISFRDSKNPSDPLKKYAINVHR